MPPRKGTGNVTVTRPRSATKYLLPVFCLTFISIVTPLVFLASHGGGVRFMHGRKGFPDGSVDTVREYRKLSAFEQIDKLFPKEMMDSIISNTDDSGPLSLNAVSRKDLSSSWVIERPVGMNFASAQKNNSAKVEKVLHSEMHQNLNVGEEGYEENKASSIEEQENLEVVNGTEHSETTDVTTGVPFGSSDQNLSDSLSPSQIARRGLYNDHEASNLFQMRVERKVKRLTALTQQDEAAAAKLEEAAIERTKQVKGDDNVLNMYSIWRKDNNENSDSFVRLMRDQLIMARVYASVAQARNVPHLLRDLRLHIKENQRALGEINVDSELPRSASERVKSMGQMLSRAREQLYDCAVITKKLRAMLQSSEEQSRVLKKQSTFLSQLAAKTLPKGLHCLSMQLTVEYYQLPEEQRGFSGVDKLEDNSLFHYALFSDNVLAVSAVVNSTVCNAKEPSKHVFHLVTDKLNYAAMRMWFLANPPGGATIEIQNIDDFAWLNSSYCPALRQLESAAMKDYYFKADRPSALAAGSSNLKYRNPKYLSMLNHLRFYLPEVYPKLNKILFLDDDIVVQKDLTPLWSVNLHGKVNGAVETCGHSFHRFDKYLNFSNPHIRRNFNPHSCGWAYGMNVFDLQEWKKRDITGIYHKWQNMNEDRVLWKLGTLPPGLITFYNLTHPLDKSWHVLGLGYNPSVDHAEIEGAAVVHYNGNMKPWLELAMTRYKNLWTKYVKYDDRLLQQCNISQ